MQNNTTPARLALTEPVDNAVFVTVSSFTEKHKAFTPGGMRHLIFTKGPELESAGVIVHFGRKLLIDEAAFLHYVKNGGTKVIAGRMAK